MIVREPPVSRMLFVLLLLLALSLPWLAAQAEKSPAAPATKQTSTPVVWPDCSNQDPKGAAPSSGVKKKSFSRVESGCVSENLYRNDFLGFSYEFPKDWAAQDPKALHELNKKWDAEDRGIPPQLRVFGQVVLPLRVYSPRIVFYASRSGEGDGSRVAIPSIRIGVQETGAKGLNLPTLRSSWKDFNEAGLKLLGPPQEFTLSGHDFFRVDLESSRTEPHSWYSRVQTFVSHHVVLFEFFASSEEELRQLANTLQSISFRKGKP